MLRTLKSLLFVSQVVDLNQLLGSQSGTKLLISRELDRLSSKFWVLLPLETLDLLAIVCVVDKEIVLLRVLRLEFH
jgi:hypothetical protein